MKEITVCVLLFLAAGAAYADGGAYGTKTPYSIYSLGDLAFPGTAYNYGMGGTGIAGRNNRFINILNPAAVTARDSLSFMADFSGYGQNRIFNQKNSDAGMLTSASNVYGIKDAVISFPIWRSSAMMVGITPYSSTGYNYSNILNGDIVAETGNIAEENTGKGSINEFFVGAGATFWKRLSIGAEFLYYFGNIERGLVQTFGNTRITGAAKYNSLSMESFSGRFGVQYEQPVGRKSSIILGATYKMGSNFRGSLSTITNMDTLAYRLDTLRNTHAIRLASEMGVGISFKYADKLTLELDYSRSDWRGTNIEKIYQARGFAPSLSQSFRFGMEYVPNRNDTRYYYKNMSYRIGGYYRDEYYSFEGLPVFQAAVTVGASFPIFRWHNALTFGVEFGQRGTLQGSMIRERFINFSVGINVFDIWFLKTQYE